MNSKTLAAEFVGTFALVAAACGAGLFASPAGGGLVAVAFAIGLAIMAMGYAVGHVSGGHFNPAVTLGLIAGGRFDTGSAIGYILAQVLGGCAAALLFQLILAGATTGGPGATTRWGSFAAISNTYGGAYGFSMIAALAVEAMATALYLVVFMGSTSSRASAGLAPLAIGGVVVALHLIAIPVSNASLNPARSTATAVLAGGVPLSQLWLFWVAPIVGGIIGGAIGRWLDED